MSPDGVLVTGIAFILGPMLWVVWLWRMANVVTFPGRPGGVAAVGSAVLGCSLLIFIILKTGASSDVVDAPEYLFMYLMVGLAWMKIAEALFRYVGLNARDDVFERGNRAAVLALIGAMIGVTLCYGGGNVGDGPGWWVVLFSAGLATAGLMMSWAVLGQLSPVNDGVAIDRDSAAGIRLGAWLIACGLILGRGVAGDWVSVSSTLFDLATALPALVVILLLGVFVERLTKPTGQRPSGPLFMFGVLPASLYLFVGVAAVCWKGWPA